MCDYIERAYKPDLSIKNIVKLLISVCENLYARKPGDDATVAAVKIRKPVVVNVMIGPPVDKNQDSCVVNRFLVVMVKLYAEVQLRKCKQNIE